MAAVALKFIPRLHSRNSTKNRVPKKISKILPTFFGLEFSTPRFSA